MGIRRSGIVFTFCGETIHQERSVCHQSNSGHIHSKKAQLNRKHSQNMMIQVYGVRVSMCNND